MPARMPLRSQADRVAVTVQFTCLRQAGWTDTDTISVLLPTGIDSHRHQRELSRTIASIRNFRKDFFNWKR